MADDRFPECRGQHLDCDICDGLRNDVQPGCLGTIVDHYAKKEFRTREERDDYYRDNPCPERDEWEDDNGRL